MIYLCNVKKMVGVAHLVRASDCGSEGSRFDPDLPPQKEKAIVTNTIAFLSLKGGRGTVIASGGALK